MQMAEINLRIYDTPFKAFRVHLSDGSSIPVTNAGMLIVGESSVILPVELGRDK